MTDNYARIVQDNLAKLYCNLPENLARDLPANQEGSQFVFQAFGQECRIGPDGITLGGVNQTSVLGILISLYALHAQPQPCTLGPLKAFKDFPNSMPYVGAFASHTEQILVPHVARIEPALTTIREALRGDPPPSALGGDFAFLVRPLPKIALCYIFYRADDEFPASVTCLYSNNALSFLPIDALADVGEYTSRKILALIE